MKMQQKIDALDKALVAPAADQVQKTLKMKFESRKLQDKVSFWSWKAFEAVVLASILVWIIILVLYISEREDFFCLLRRRQPFKIRSKKLFRFIDLLKF